MKKVRTHYDNLKVARDAPPEVIRAAYKSLAQKYHPDRNPGNERAARIMKLINTSYEVLSDPDQRARHDGWIAEQEAPAQSEARPNHQEQPEPPAGSPAEQRSFYETGRVRNTSHYDRYWFFYLTVVVIVGGSLLYRHYLQDDFEIIRPTPTPPVASEKKAMKENWRPQKKNAVPRQASAPRSVESTDHDVNEPRTDHIEAPEPAPLRDHTPETYSSQLAQEIGKDQTYPSRAQKLGWQGTTEVLVRIGVDGRLKEVSIAQSSGYEILDQEAIQKVRRTKSFPAPPSGFEGREFSVLVPIVFKLG